MIGQKHKRYIQNASRERLEELDELICLREEQLDDLEEDLNDGDLDDMNECKAKYCGPQSWVKPPIDPPVQATPSNQEIYLNYVSSFANLSRQTYCTPCVQPCVSTPVKRNTNMYAHAHVSQNTPLPTDQVQRDYLIERLYSMEYPKAKELRKLFNMDAPAAPKTPKELAARLAAGKYTVKGLEKDTSDDEDNYAYVNWTGYFSWADPALKADKDGYKAAEKALASQLQTVKDTIVISEPAAGLDALKAFEAWMPTVATTVAN